MIHDEDYRPGDDTRMPGYVNYENRPFGGYGPEADEVGHHEALREDERGDFTADYGSSNADSLCQHQFVSGSRKGEFCDKELDPVKSKVLGVRRCSACVGLYLRQLPEPERTQIREAIEDEELSAMKELSGRTQQRQKPLADIYHDQLRNRKRKREEKKIMKAKKKRRTGATFLHSWAVKRGVLKAGVGDAAYSANSDGPYIGSNPHLSQGQNRSRLSTPRSSLSTSPPAPTTTTSRTKAAKAGSTPMELETAGTELEGMRSAESETEPEATKKAKSNEMESAATEPEATKRAANEMDSAATEPEATKRAANEMDSAATEPEQPSAELKRLGEEEKKQMLEIEAFGQPRNEEELETIAEMEEDLKSIRLKIRQLSSKKSKN